MSTHFRSDAMRLSIRFLFCVTAIAIAAIAGSAQQPATKTLTLRSTVLGEERTVLVRTPAGYDANNEKYPVLYMTDGDTHMGHTSSTIQFLVRNGRMADLIVVGVTNTDRTRDLTPAKSTARNAAGQLQSPTSGGADNFLKFFETELIPTIEKQYRVQPYRIFAGHSFGGLFAVHAMITKPGLFNAYIAASPSLQWVDNEALKRAEHFLSKQKELKVTLFTSLGNEPGGIGDAFDKFKAALAKTSIKGFEWQAEHWTDEDHGSVVLRTHYSGLRKIYDGWQGPRDLNTGNVLGGLKGADAHYAKLSEKFGYSITVPENLINQLGYQLLFEGRSDEAIAVFKANLERYPNSANVYDSLAEAYEQGQRYDLATPLYEKAHALGQQTNDPNTALFKTNYERSLAKLKEGQGKKQ